MSEELQALRNLAGSFELVFGVLYAIFGKGPELPRVSPGWRAFWRFLTPVPMFVIALLQSDDRRKT